MSPLYRGITNVYIVPISEHVVLKRAQTYIVEISEMYFFERGRKRQISEIIGNVTLILVW